MNAGLARRFAIEDAFYFEDFTNDELREIIDLKLKMQDLSATDEAKVVALEVLDRARNRTTFGNAGEVENLLAQAKNRYQTRQMSVPTSKRSVRIVFEPQDFDPNFDRDKHATSNLTALFEDVVGCETIIAMLAKYQNLARALKARNKGRESIPTTFVFKGPPGGYLLPCLPLNLRSNIRYQQAQEKPPSQGKWARFTLIWAFYLPLQLLNVRHLTSLGAMWGKQDQKQSGCSRKLLAKYFSLTRHIV